MSELYKDKKEIRGIITRGVGGLYAVRPLSGKGEEILCRARGILRLEQLTPTVGDRVTIKPIDENNSLSDAESDEKNNKTENRRAEGNKSKSKKPDVQVDWVIDEVLPRKSHMIRPALSNLDYLFAVIPAASPEPDLLTADKLTVIAENYGIETVVIINKADLYPKKAGELCEIYSIAGYKTLALSAAVENDAGVGELFDYIKSLTENSPDGSCISGAFAGVSGAGKSTLMTALFPELHLVAGRVSRKTERGRHTTRHVELYPINLGEGVFYLADTPGFSMLDFTRFDFFPYDELALSFREFGDCIGRCKYTKCTHLKEEGCAVLAKLDEGKIAKSRHDSYIRIYEEQRSVPEWKRR